MRVLIIKTSSMGDVIHTLPALTDALRAIPGIRFDWVVEPGFQLIPGWHLAVQRVIPFAFRAFRKRLMSMETWKGFLAFRRAMREQQYDAVIDAQGLLKSALIARMASGPRFGLDWRSAREPFATVMYQHRVSVPRNRHAIARVRMLLAGALGYALPETPPDYGIDRARLGVPVNPENDLVFLHGTTWATKHWPEAHWKRLAHLAVERGYRIRLPSGNPTERARAERIAEGCAGAEVLPRLDLAGLAQVLSAAKGIVAVDTGLGHLAAALGVPGVSLYGPTSPALSGAIGPLQAYLAADFVCAPCFGRECAFRGAVPELAGEKLSPPCLGGVTPEKVWVALEQSISLNR